MTGSITHISDTARWVAFYRAMETERPDALFRDPFARLLAGPEGEAIVNTMKDGRKNAWPMIVRTAVMDEIILREVAGGADTVLNLAAGLDARPYRLPLPASLRWVDVDLPDMVDYKAGIMAGHQPVCSYEGVRLDLADGPARRVLFERVNAAATRTLVISEGLLVYLQPDAVTELARDLHALPSFGKWLTDLASPGLLKMMAKTWGPAVARGGAPFLFGPANGPRFFEPAGWREAEFRSTFAESLRLNRTFRFARVMNWLGRFAPAKRQEEFRYFSGVLLLERM